MARPRKYNWKNLFALSRSDTCEFSLRRGVDYDCRDESIIQQIRNQASARDLDIKVRQTEVGITALIIGERK